MGDSTLGACDRRQGGYVVDIVEDIPRHKVIAAQYENRGKADIIHNLGFARTYLRSLLLAKEGIAHSRIGVEFEIGVEKVVVDNVSFFGSDCRGEPPLDIVDFGAFLHDIGVGVLHHRVEA